MKIALLYYEDASAVRQRQDDPQTYWAAWSGYIDAIREAGVMAGGEGLQPHTVSTTLRGTVIHDGPYAETKDQLGGFVTLQVASMDEALEWAAKAPCVESGAVELRPVIEMEG